MVRTDTPPDAAGSLKERDMFMKQVLLAIMLMGMFAIWPAVAETERYMLGDTEVRIVIEKYGSGNKVFVALHENESTSVAAAKAVLSKYGGTLLMLKHGGGRNVAFSHAGKSYKFDPNRIFSDSGIRATLGGAYDPAAHKIIAGLAKEIRGRLTGRAIYALHNNTDGAYSISSYLPSGQYAREASEVHVVSGADPDDFFFVTNSATFRLLRELGFNVALQSGNPKDDGSLSVFASGGTYVNIEAQSGHSAYQQKMIRALFGD